MKVSLILSLNYSDGKGDVFWAFVLIFLLDLN